ncbi:MAG: PUA domain-containing protein [Candidatus Kariarchaeaceae archaeon]
MEPSQNHMEKLESTLYFQFPGLDTAEVLKDITINLSRKTGRIRGVFDRDSNIQLFSLRTNDGRYLPTFTGALRIHDSGYTGMRVVMEDEASPFIAKGKSAFCKHIVSAGKEIIVGSEVLVYDIGGNLLAVGTAQQPGYAMEELQSGLAVRVKHSVEKST